MKPAAKHPNEQQRLDSLNMLNILDTLPEEDFDEIALLAAQICDMPIALISLVDDKRQWFKSKFGLAAAETPKELAFCAHAILQDDVFIVSDSSKDERFFDNPLATGAPHVCFYAGAPLLSPDGLPIGTVCVIDSKPRTLTDGQKNALLALAHQVTRLLELKAQLNKFKISEEKLLIKKTAIDNISEGVVLQDSHGTIIDFNPAALEVLGLTADQLSGKSSMDPQWQAVREDGSALAGPDHPAMVSLRTGEKQVNKVMGIHKPAGDQCWLKVNSIPLFLDGSKTPSHCVTSFADITNIKKLEVARRTLEANLSETARLSALGEMAGGIAHEINNPLAIIQGKSRLLRRKLEDKGLNPKDNLKDFQTIEDTVERISKIIKGLKTYSRDAEKDPFEEVKVSSILEDTLELCKERFKNSSVEIKVSCEANLTIQCRPSQISQVIMNLLMNSFDAVSDLPEKWIDIKVSTEAGSAKIVMTDSGSGISDAIAAKIMQPFFTTKEVGKGTGLGLSISKGIAEIHHGFLQYNSKAKNTSFTLTLPLQQPQRTPKAA